MRACLETSGKLLGPRSRAWEGFSVGTVVSEVNLQGYRPGIGTDSGAAEGLFLSTPASLHGGTRTRLRYLVPDIEHNPRRFQGQALLSEECLPHTPSLESHPREHDEDTLPVWFRVHSAGFVVLAHSLPGLPRVAFCRPLLQVVKDVDVCQRWDVGIHQPQVSPRKG